MNQLIADYVMKCEIEEEMRTKSEEQGTKMITKNKLSVDDVVNNYSEKEIYSFLRDLTIAVRNKYKNFPLTYEQEQQLKVSVNDDNYKQDILLTNDYGIDISTREGSDLIVNQEDSELLTQARLAEKKRMFRLVAREEMKLGMIPFSNKTISGVNKIKNMNEFQRDNIKHSICINITVDELDDTRQKKLLSKTWIRNKNHFSKTEDGYRLIVGYDYTNSGGTKSKKSMSMMKKEIGSTLKITTDCIDTRVISKDEYRTLTTEQVD